MCVNSSQHGNVLAFLFAAAAQLGKSTGILIQTDGGSSPPGCTVYSPSAKSPGIFDPGGYFKTAPLPQIPSLFAGEHHRLPCAGFFFACDEDDLHMGNPRYANGSLRRKHRARLRAMRCECGICHGRFGPIHYDEPSDAAHPLSFVIDEIRPVSKWRQFGYPSARATAEDWNNLQAAHYFCNAQKGNKTAQNEQKSPKKLTKAPTVRDGNW